MPTDISASLRPLRRLRLARAGLLGLCALACGCEPELGTDASSSDAAVGEAEAGVADTGIPDSSVEDAALGSDGSTPAGSDAATSAGEDASERDASPAPEASTPASDGATSDASPLDAGASDADTSRVDAAVDAQRPSDAAPTDTSVLGDASPGDAGLAVRMRSGEVRWGVQSGQGSAFCPLQSIALWKDETLTLEDRTSPGFACTDWFDTCPRPAPGEVTNATYIFRNADMEFHLTFRGSVLQGYSIEAFRENLLQTSLTWTSETKTSIGDRQARFIADFEPELELVSYEAPMLHVRLRGTANWGPSFRQQATVPYVCFHQTPGGPVPDICTDVFCSYRVADLDSAVHVSVDLKARIQQPDP